jgi:hypothetical protein
MADWDLFEPQAPPAPTADTSKAMGVLLKFVATIMTPGMTLAMHMSRLNSALQKKQATRAPHYSPQIKLRLSMVVGHSLAASSLISAILMPLIQ